MKVFQTPSMSGLPQIWAGSSTGYPRSRRIAALARWPLRMVGSLWRYSTLALRNPSRVRGSPTLAATWVRRPSPSKYSPARVSSSTPSEASRNLRLRTPAMASEPYWAAAPSRSSSIWAMAMAGITLRSGPCEPVFRELPSSAMTPER